MIEGVLIHLLKQIPEKRRRIMHMLRVDDPHFEKFGEIYENRGDCLPGRANSLTSQATPYNHEEMLYV